MSLSDIITQEHKLGDYELSIRDILAIISFIGAISIELIPYVDNYLPRELIGVLLLLGGLSTKTTTILGSLGLTQGPDNSTDEEEGV